MTDKPTEQTCTCNEQSVHIWNEYTCIVSPPGMPLEEVLRRFPDPLSLEASTIAALRSELAKKDTIIKEHWEAGQKMLRAWMDVRDKAEKYKSLAGKLAIACEDALSALRGWSNSADTFTKAQLEEALKLWREKNL